MIGGKKKEAKLFPADLFDVCYKEESELSFPQRGPYPICGSLNPTTICFSPESFSSHSCTGVEIVYSSDDGFNPGECDGNQSICAWLITARFAGITAYTAIQSLLSSIRGSKSWWKNLCVYIFATFHYILQHKHQKLSILHKTK